MPITINTSVGHAAGLVYQSPFIGPVEFTAQVPVVLSNMTTGEIDADGYLKPGVFIKTNGKKPDGTANEFVLGATIEPLKVANDGLPATIAALPTIDVGVCTACQVNRKIIVDQLGRALTAAEVAATNAAGSGIILLG